MDFSDNANLLKIIQHNELKCWQT